jgi:hypothetical protein
MSLLAPMRRNSSRAVPPSVLSVPFPVPLSFGLLALLLFVCGTASPALEPPGVELAPQPSRSGLPVVLVESGGFELRFAIDTGTSLSLVSAEAAERLGLVPRARFSLASAAAPPQTAVCGRPPPLRLAGMDVTLDCLGWVPEERSLAGAEDVDGLLGSDAIAQLDLWLDVGRGRTRVAPPRTLLAWTDGERVPLETIHHRPAIQLELPCLGRRHPPVSMVLDSGADAAVLFGEIARRVGTATSRAPLRRAGLVQGATASRAAIIVPLGVARAGGSDGVYLDAGLAGLLPQVDDRVEAGLVPLRVLGPVLLDLSSGVLVLRARPRNEPRAETAAPLVAAMPRPHGTDDMARGGGPRPEP